jgi:hypothetical protein
VSHGDQKWGHVIFFGKPLLRAFDEGCPKTYDMPPFCGDQKVLVAIE